MASKKAIFNYGGGKRDIKHSKYDMSNQQLFDSDFGELGVVGMYETLPDDNWKISENAMTLVKPMTAPAFTRIHQNYYSFYVRNSAVWKYWHDFITDGSAHNQVYGANNQRSALSGSWKVPCVRMNDIQMIAKIARGYAIPTVVLDISFQIRDASGDRMRVFYGDKAVGRDVTDFFAALGSMTSYPSGNAEEIWATIRYIVRNLAYYQAIGYSFQSNVLTMRVTCGDSFYKLSTLRNIFANNDNIRVVSQEFDQQGESISRNSTSSVSAQSDFFFLPTLWRFFQDEVNNEDFKPPFIHTLNRNAYMYDIASVSTSSGNKYYRSYDFVRNDDEVGEFSQFGEPQYINGGENINTGYNFGFYQFSNIFWGKKYSIHYGSNELFLMNWDIIKPGYFNGGGFSWSIPLSLFGHGEDNSDLDYIKSVAKEIFGLIPNYFGAPAEDYRYLLEGTHEALESNLTEFCNGAGSEYHSIGLSPFPFFGMRNVSSDRNSFYNIGFGFCTKHCFDVIVPLLSARVFNSGNVILGDSSYASYMRNDWLYSVGYTSDAWLIYLAKNSLKLLDGMGLSFEPVAARSFSDYKFERFNVLPAMCYSKVWDDFYRNRVTSSPELDFKMVNGFGFLSKSCVDYLQTRTSYDPDIIPDWVDEVKPNSWLLDVNVRPMNGEQSIVNTLLLSGTQQYQIRQYFDGSDNHFVVNSWFHLMSLLTGYGLRELFLHERFEHSLITFQDGSKNNISFFEFTTLFSDNFYLPQYYNGLLHLKYQNFNKDYFTSAMLDPLSGTDEVEIGDTVTSLRRAEIEQSMAEQVAQSRSVRDYYKRIFGNVPKLDENSAVFLGSDHIDVNIGQVIQTSQTTEDSAQGTRSGLGGAHGSGRLVKHHCDDHGFIFVLCSHTVESQYMNTYSKKLDVKDSYLDYPTINYANIGNESIKIKELNYTTPASQVLQPFGTALNQLYYGDVIAVPGDKAVTKMDGRQSPELLSTKGINGISDITSAFSSYRYLNLAKGTGTGLDNVFGFIPRYSSYKFEFDRVHGSLREQLQYWHSFRKFGSQPMLTHDFVNWELLSTDNDFDRLFATAADIDAKFVINLFLNAVVSRALPFVCVPKTKSS